MNTLLSASRIGGDSILDSKSELLGAAFSEIALIGLVRTLVLPSHYLAASNMRKTKTMKAISIE
jgi:hypothetical protein